MKRHSLAALFTLVLALLVTGFGAVAGPSSVPPGLARAIAAQAAHTDALLTRAGVVGTAVGAGAHGAPVVKIYTESSHVAGLPAHLDGVPVEVEVTGELVAQASLTRPSPIGVSSGNQRLTLVHQQLYCTVGTLGARVTDGTNVYALSNAHVYALEGSKTSGTVQAGATGDKILQPGRVDMVAQACGSASEIDAAVIGKLWSFVPVEISRKANNTVDAALALVSTAAVGTATPVGGYGTPATTTVVPSLGMSVQKYGRTTGLTKGTITGVNATVLIKYDEGQARFVDQVVVTGSGAFSDGGDSGSLIVTQNGNFPVALLFAGSSSSTIGNRIDSVLGALGGVTIDNRTP
jgi:hypothetical protein